MYVCMYVKAAVQKEDQRCVLMMATDISLPQRRQSSVAKE